MAIGALMGTNEQLLTAADRGDLDAVRRELGLSHAPDAEGEGGRTALMFAAARGHLGVVDALVAAGADVNKADAHGVTPLVEASRHGHPDVVRRLLHAGAELTIDVNRNERNAVLYALDAGHTGVADLLKAVDAPRTVPSLRGVESFDLDARWIAVNAGIDHAAEAFHRNRKAMTWSRDVWGKPVTLQGANYLALQFRAHAWTLVTELHAADDARLAPEEAVALSHATGERALFFETSDLTGRIRYRLYRSNALLEDFDTTRAEELAEANDLVRRKLPASPMTLMLNSTLRKVTEGELVNPADFVSRYFTGLGIFVPAIAVGSGQAGDTGDLFIPGYQKSDFVRLDFFAV